MRRLLSLASQRALAAFGKRVAPALPRTDRMPPSRAESDAFREQVLLRVVEEAFELSANAALPRDKATFDALLAAGHAPYRRRLRAGQPGPRGAWWRSSTRPSGRSPRAAKQPSGTLAAKDIRAQLELLFVPDLVLSVELAQLEHYPRYLRAAQTRLARAITDPRKDADKLAPFAPVWSAFLDKRQTAVDRAAARALHWAFEELRVAIFAPELKPAFPVSLGARHPQPGTAALKAAEPRKARRR